MSALSQVGEGPLVPGARGLIDRMNRLRDVTESFVRWCWQPGVVRGDPRDTPAVSRAFDLRIVRAHTEKQNAALYVFLLERIATPRYGRTAEAAFAAAEAALRVDLRAIKAIAYSDATLLDEAGESARDAATAQEPEWGVYGELRRRSGAVQGDAGGQGDPTAANQVRDARSNTAMLMKDSLLRLVLGDDGMSLCGVRIEPTCIVPCESDALGREGARRVQVGTIAQAAMQGREPLFCMTMYAAGHVSASVENALRLWATLVQVPREDTSGLVPVLAETSEERRVAIANLREIARWPWGLADSGSLHRSLPEGPCIAAVEGARHQRVDGAAASRNENRAVIQSPALARMYELFGLPAVVRLWQCPVTLGGEGANWLARR